MKNPIESRRRLDKNLMKTGQKKKIDLIPSKILIHKMKIRLKYEKQVVENRRELDKDLKAMDK